METSQLKSEICNKRVAIQGSIGSVSTMAKAGNTEKGLVLFLLYPSPVQIADAGKK
jgi:hypothetical protein